jgi:hypothetical protein
MNLSGAICFLVINQIDELPSVAIKSALRNSNLPVLVGYISEQDIQPLRNLPVEFVRIAHVETPVDRGNYSAFDQEDFYRIVMNKWELLLHNLPQYDFLVYSDIDVIWIRDAATEISSIFERKPEVDLIMQSFGSNEVSPNLCMGFIGIRNSQRAIDFIESCKVRHKELLLDNPRIGDDDVTTELLSNLKYPLWLHRLSPIYFPAGNTLDLFTGTQSFPGLPAPLPYVFHLNFLIGLKNKRLMLRIISSHNPSWGIDSRMTFSWRFLLLLKKCRRKFGS